MSTLRFERFLARLYTDAELLQRFLADPMNTAARHGLDDTERSWLRDVDRAGLVFANEQLRPQTRVAPSAAAPAPLFGNTPPFLTERIKRRLRGAVVSRS